MRSVRPLKGLKFFLNVECAGNNDDRDMGRGRLKFRQELRAALAIGKDMVKNNHVWNGIAQRFERGSAAGHASESVAAQRLRIKTELPRVVFDHQNAGRGGGIHSSRFETNGKYNLWKLCIWRTGYQQGKTRKVSGIRKVDSRNKDAKRSAFARRGLQAQTEPIPLGNGV